MLLVQKVFTFAILLCVLAHSTLGATIQSPGFQKKVEALTAALAKERAQENTTVDGSISEPTEPTHQGPRGGVFFPYTDSDCSRRSNGPFIIRPVDKCFSVLGEGFRFKSPAVCENGTNAMVAKFAGKNCHNPVNEPLVEVDEDNARQCMDTGNLKSMAFWCDGVPGVDLEEKGSNDSSASRRSNGASLGIILGFILLFILLSLLGVILRARGLLIRIQNLFRRGDGQIQL